MKAGTIVELPDGRVGTVVFNGLVGVGIKWGKHTVTAEDLEGTHGDLALIGIRAPEPTEEQREWRPDAVLRDWKESKLHGMECVGEEYKIIYQPTE